MGNFVKAVKELPKLTRLHAQLKSKREQAEKDFMKLKDEIAKHDDELIKQKEGVLKNVYSQMEVLKNKADSSNAGMFEDQMKKLDKKLTEIKQEKEKKQG